MFHIKKVVVSNPVKLLTGDATKLDLPGQSVNMIITHPPYLGIDVTRYGGEASAQINNSGNKKKMLKLLLAATKEMVRVLKADGQIWIANGPNEHLDMEYVLMVEKKLGLKYIESVVQNSYGYSDWARKERAFDENILSSSTTTWHHFSISEYIYFNPYAVKKYNSPVWNMPFNNMDDSIDQLMSTDFHVYDVMNRGIPERFIEMFSKPGHVILDPFGGSGLVAVTAAKAGRKGISNDISPDQTKAAIKRCNLSMVDYEL